MAARALFIAEAATLAHVGRAIQLATFAHRAGHDVVLACDARYSRFVAGAPFATRSIASMPSERFLDALAHGRPVFTASMLSEYVRDDLALLAEVAPDVVVGDFRLSLSVSARRAGVCYVNVTNAYWSPYARPDFRLPSLSFTRYIPVALAEPVFRLVRPLAFAAHALPLNRVRRANGLAPLGLDMRNAYCDGDLTLYTDVPDLIPLIGAPSSHRTIGPVLWSPAVEPPPWWPNVIEGEPPIYVSLGSSGPAGLLGMVVEALRPLARPIVVATAGRGADPPRAADVWVADFVDGEAIAAKACVVVCNGGSPTTQQALVHGVPVVGIASNLDQFLNMAYIEHFGAGTLLRADRTHATEVREATRRAVEDAAMRARAGAVGALAAGCSAEAAFAAAIGEPPGGRAQAPTDAVS